MKAVEQGIPKLAAAKEFGITRSTLQDKSTGSFLLGLRLGRFTVLTTAEEKDSVEWVKRMARRGLPVRREDIVPLVQKMLEDDPDHETCSAAGKLRKSGLNGFS